MEEMAHLVSEELELMLGFKTEVVKDKGIKIKMDTIAGEYLFSPDSKQTLMFNVYRFISNYGGKLHAWGLENKIKEYAN